MREKNYIVNPEKKIVVAILKANIDNVDDMKGIADEVIRECSRTTIYAILELIEKAGDFDMSNLDIPYEVLYKGIAKCDEHDEFNEEIGKKIAGNKAEMKYHIAMAKKYKVLVSLIEKAYEELYVLECKHANKAFKINNNIKKYTER